MPVKSLESYLFERGLTFTHPIESLKNARLGIDVNHYLSRMVGFKRETLLDAVGGFPQSIRVQIESDLQVFGDHNITPVFVFSGNDIGSQYELKSSKEQTSIQKIRASSWNNYQSLAAQHSRSSFPPPAHETFRDFFTIFNSAPFIPQLISFLVERDIEFIRAPYLSWVQLSYLYEEDYIDAIYGPTETLLLAQVEKFILGMEFTSEEFRYIDKAKVLNAFGVNELQLLDIAVAVGCDLQPTTLPLFQNYPPNIIFDVGLEIVNSGGSIYHTILGLNNPQITEKFQKGVLALQFLPVLKFNGRVEIQKFDELNNIDPKKQPPTDIHDIVGQRLPHEYYFYQSIGLIQPDVLEAISFGTYIIKSPLDGSFTNQYKNTINKIIDAFKNKEINLLTQNMSRFYQVKKIDLVKPFQTTNIELENRVNPPLYFKINPLIIRSDLKKFDSFELINYLIQNDSLDIPATKLENDDDPKRLKNDHEIIATSCLRLFHLLEFIDFKDSKFVPTKWTRALYKIHELDVSFKVEQYLSFLIFLKLNSFKLSDDLSANLVGSSKTKDPEQRKIVQLVSRLSLFIDIDSKKQSYTGPISRSLLNVRSSIDLINSSTRELLESILVNSLANNEVTKIQRSNKDWRKLVVQIPFQNITSSTALPIVLQSFFDYHFSGTAIDTAKTSTLEYFNSSNNVFNDLSKDFNRGLKFVQETYQLVKVLQEDRLIDNEFFEIYGKADNLAKKVLDTAK